MRIELDPADLKPIVEAVVSEMLARFQSDSERLAYSEAEAANLLGMKSHVLRDERLRGRVSAARVGRSFRYTRESLIKYLAVGSDKESTI